MKSSSYLVRYSPSYEDPQLDERFVECFRDVFADTPWHEWKKCPKCKKYWGKQDQERLEALDYRHCGTTLEDFWPKDEVTRDLCRNIPIGTSCWLAMRNNSQVIGFCRGYPLTIDQLEQKLGLELSSGLQEFSAKIAYQEQLGVLPPYRNKKFATQMVKLRLQDFLQQGLGTGIVRVREKPEPSGTFLWYTRLGYTILAKYPEEDGRVILVRDLKGLYSKL